MVIQEISSFIEGYFEVLQTQEMALFDKVFHKDCVLYSRQDGVTVARPFDEYRRMVQSRQSPQAGGFPCQNEVLGFDMLSADMVTVKVRLRLFDNIMEDHLNLMKADGRWMVYAKHFHRAGAAS